MSSALTLITSHSLEGPESEANHSEQRRFAEFVSARQPQLLDFQAYVSDDKRQLKLMFVFPDGAGSDERSAEPEPLHRDFRDSGLAAVLIGAALLVLVFVAAYIGSIGSPVA
jgi:hypothetical protein